jgi:hypothetical protein
VVIEAVNGKRADNAMAKSKRTSNDDLIKHYTENERLSSTN